MDSYSAQRIESERYLTDAYGTEHVAELKDWGTRIEAFLPSLRARMGYPDPEPLTPAERERAEAEAEENCQRYAHTTNDCDYHNRRFARDPGYYLSLSDEDLARAVYHGWEGGYYEHY